MQSIFVAAKQTTLVPTRLRLKRSDAPSEYIIHIYGGNLKLMKFYVLADRSISYLDRLRFIQFLDIGETIERE